MFYFAVAVIWTTILWANYPPSFTFKKVIIVEHQYQTPSHTHTHTEITEQQMEDLKDISPPTLDDIVSTLNETLYDIGGED